MCKASHGAGQRWTRLSTPFLTLTRSPGKRGRFSLPCEVFQINWNQMFSTTGIKTHEDRGRGQFLLTVHILSCLQTADTELGKNGKKQTNKQQNLVLYCFQGISRRYAHSCRTHKMSFWAITPCDFLEAIISLHSLSTRWWRVESKAGLVADTTR